MLAKSLVGGRLLRIKRQKDVSIVDQLDLALAKLDPILSLMIMMLNSFLCAPDLTAQCPRNAVTFDCRTGATSADFAFDPVGTSKGQGIFHKVTVYYKEW